MTHPSQPPKTEKAAVILLSGFLGAGKTTLLKQIIAWEDKLTETVIIVNEFGNVGIDGALIKDSGSDVVELTSGCICCTLNADLEKSLEGIWKRFHPRRIIIESSGVADPTPIVAVLQESGLARSMHLEKIVTVMDADFWDAREMFGPLFYNQLEAADLILLNKVDLVAKDRIPEFLEQLHECVPHARVVPTFQCGIDPETLWAPGRSRTVGIKPIQFYLPDDSATDTAGADNHYAHPAESASAHHFITFAFQEYGILDETAFNQFMERLPREVFRVKGPVRFRDRTVMINYVGGKIQTLPWNDKGTTELAFIGWDIDGETVLADLTRCVIRPH